jgi:hypothetical protein
MWNIKPSIEGTGKRVGGYKGVKASADKQNKSEKVAWVHNQISAGQKGEGGNTE